MSVVARRKPLKIGTFGGMRDEARAKALLDRAKARRLMRGIASGTTQQAIRTGGWSNPSMMGQGELKFIDTTPGATLTAAVATFGVATLLNGCIPGSGASDRIGRKITMKSLLCRWAVTLQPTSTQGSPIRILIVYDKQANTTAPAVTDILLADAFLSQNNLSNRDRFVTLMDLITPPLTAGNDYVQAGVFYKRLNLETMFNAGTAGTVGDITSGSVYMFAAQLGNIATAGPVVATRCRIRYTDV